MLGRCAYSIILFARTKPVAHLHLLRCLDDAVDFFHDGGRVDDDTVAGAAEDLAVMGCVQPPHDFATSAQRVEDVLLVSAHQPPVAGDMSGEDACMPAFRDQSRPGGQKQAASMQGK